MKQSPFAAAAIAQEMIASPGTFAARRPHRPHGRDWVWYSEGGRQGWHHKQRRVWHYNKW